MGSSFMKEAESVAAEKMKEASAGVTGSLLEATNKLSILTGELLGGAKDISAAVLISLNETTAQLSETAKNMTTTVSAALSETGRQVSDALPHVGEYIGFETVNLTLENSYVKMLMVLTGFFMVACSCFLCSKAIFRRRTPEQIVLNNCPIFIAAGDQQLPESAQLKPLISKSLMNNDQPVS